MVALVSLQVALRRTIIFPLRLAAELLNFSLRLLRVLLVAWSRGALVCDNRADRLEIADRRFCFAVMQEAEAEIIMRLGVARRKIICLP